MDFKEMKERILIVDVLMHYGVRLRTKLGSEYGSTACPLPTHPKDDRGNNAFNVHLPSNRWQCKHKECGRRNTVGDRWGDCINFVMAMDHKSFKEAGTQLEQWFPKENPAPNNGTREDGRSHTAPHHHTSDITSPPEKVNTKGFMKDVDAWFDTIIQRNAGETDEVYWKRIRTGFKTMLIHSFRNGKLAAQGLSE